MFARLQQLSKQLQRRMETWHTALVPQRQCLSSKACKTSLSHASCSGPVGTHCNCSHESICTARGQRFVGLARFLQIAVECWSVPEAASLLQGQAYAAQDRGRRRAVDNSAPSGAPVPMGLWGLRPTRTAGNGIAQESPKFMYWARKLLALHVHLLALNGELDVVQRMAGMLHTGLGWADPACTADLARCAGIMVSHQLHGLCTKLTHNFSVLYIHSAAPHPAAVSMY